ncbi:PREDICTED: claudin-15-like [Gekko japonicus]|uniref:Claudin-15-like n=1 Tax=Gekko japonicus TaxID=146911 RepID=A0ABM1KXA2_GEKJA|nr:PREDICTED: claudin-15-like [Gekko japonicus]
MASSSFQISALLLAALGIIILLIATASNSWKTSSSTNTVNTAGQIYEGLWMNCATSVQCKSFYFFLSLDTYIQACRALMVTSLVLGLLGTLVTVFGLECTQLGSTTKYTKAKIATIGGIVFILSGLSSMVAISWYASRITAQFFDSLYAGTKYELGVALYIGWAGSLLSMLGGMLLTFSCKGSKRQKQRNYHYDPAATQRATEPCIYNKMSETVTSAKDYV